MKNLGTLKCLKCGGETPKRSVVQKYCIICSAERTREIGNRWAISNPLNVEQKEKRYAAKAIRDKNARDIAAAEGARYKSNTAWEANADVHLIWQVRVSVPFDFGFSKNAIWRHGKGGHVYLREDSKRLRDNLQRRIKEAVSQEDAVSAKVWVDILVQKPGHRGDAINVIDTVCDAIKKALAIDDNWFSIRRLDWEIVKENPMLFVGVGQETNIPHGACSYCGRLKPLAENFGKRKHTKSGYTSVCWACSRGDDKRRRINRKFDEII